MELFQKEGYYVIKNGAYSLWCSRFDGSIEPRKGLLQIVTEDSEKTRPF